MPRRPSTPAFRGKAQRGFTFVELLVVLAILGFMALTMLSFFLVNSGYRRQADLPLEVNQGLRAALDTLVRDTRLAGVCLPTLGDFISLAGANNGTKDGFTVRSGFVRGNQICIRAAIREAMPQNSLEVKVESVEGFQDGMLAYVVHPDGSGEFFRITQVQAASLLLQRDSGATRDYPVGSGVYAIEERAYAIDTVTFGRPVLNLSIDRQPPQPLVNGIEGLDIRYRLNRNCPACDTVNLPVDDEWRLVNEVIITATAVASRPRSNGDLYRQAAVGIAKPRNLLP